MCQALYKHALVCATAILDPEGGQGLSLLPMARCESITALLGWICPTKCTWGTKDSKLPGHGDLEDCGKARKAPQGA